MVGYALPKPTTSERPTEMADNIVYLTTELAIAGLKWPYN
jgi:hypothetical protein